MADLPRGAWTAVVVGKAGVHGVVSIEVSISGSERPADSVKINEEPVSKAEAR